MGRRSSSWHHNGVYGVGSKKHNYKTSLAQYMSHALSPCFIANASIGAEPTVASMFRCARCI